MWKAYQPMILWRKLRNWRNSLSGSRISTAVRLALPAVFALCVLFIAPSVGFSTVPTKVEWHARSNNAGQNATQLRARCPYAASAGDAIFAFVLYSGADPVTTIGDNQGGNTWVKDITGSNFDFIRAVNLAAGTRTVNITLSAGTGSTGAMCALMNNIATATPVDTSCDSAAVSGTSLGCGPITTTSDGDEIITCAVNTGANSNTAPPTFTASSGAVLFLVDPFSIFVCQYQNQSTHGAISPTITSSQSLASAEVMSIAYKTATSGGSQHTGLFAPIIQEMNWSAWQENVSTALSGTSFTTNVPLPSAVNLIDVAWQSNNTVTLNSVTSSPSNTWTCTMPANGTSVKVGHCYAVNVSNASGTMTLTFALSATPDVSTKSFTVSLAAFEGAAASPLDATCNTAHNSMATSGALADDACTTVTANDVLFALRQEDAETVTSASTSGGTLYDGQEDTGVYLSFSGDQDEGVGLLYAGAAGSYTLTWTYSNYDGGVQIGNYATQALAWAPASSAIPGFNKQRRYEQLEATAH